MEKITLKNVKLIAIDFNRYNLVLEPDDSDKEFLKTINVLKKYGEQEFVNVRFNDIYQEIKIWNGDSIDVGIYKPSVSTDHKIFVLYYLSTNKDPKEDEMLEKGKKFIDDFSDTLSKEQIFEILHEYILN